MSCALSRGIPDRSRRSTSALMADSWFRAATMAARDFGTHRPVSWLATLVSLNKGDDWLVVTPDGLFDGSPGGWNQILWRFSPASMMFRRSRFSSTSIIIRVCYPDILAGKKIAAAADISQKDRRQPKLSLETADAARTPEVFRLGSMKVRIKITEAPAGAQDVRLFRNGSLVKVWRGDVLKGQARRDARDNNQRHSRTESAHGLCLQSRQCKELRRDTGDQRSRFVEARGDASHSRRRGQSIRKLGLQPQVRWARMRARSPKKSNASSESLAATGRSKSRRCSIATPQKRT